MSWIVCVAGDDNGTGFRLNENDQVMGRAPGCEIQLFHGRVSSRHCRVRQKGKTLIITDLGSSNGIKYNGKRYKDKTVKLKYGQQFAIGEDVFTYMEHHDALTDAGEEALEVLKATKDSQIIGHYSEQIAAELEAEKRARKKSFWAKLFGK